MPSVLDHGEIVLLDVMGSDADIVKAARVSYSASKNKTHGDDRALIRYLMKHKHTSPFEMAELKFYVKAPIYIARQWMRHRTANINEVSYRYSVVEDCDFYTPIRKEVRSQSKNNKQCGGDPLPINVTAAFINEYNTVCCASFDGYTDALQKGVSREVARGMLPQSTYTEFYWKIDLHNLLHFLNLRMHPHAQEQIRAYANIMFDMVKKKFPITVEAFEDYVLHAKTFSRQQMELLREIIATGSFDPINPHENLSARETQDLLDAIGWIETGVQK